MDEISIDVDHAARGRKRLRVLLRPLLDIPLAVAGLLWALAGFAGGALAWLAIVLSGRYPRGLYHFNARALRFGLRSSGYALLLTDRFPGLDGAPDDAYPIRLEVAPRRRRYRRRRVILRPLKLPLVGVLVALHAAAAAVRASLSAVPLIVLGRHPRRGFQSARRFLDYAGRAAAYAFWISDSFPRRAR